MEKHSRRERNRAKDFLHKLTTKINGIKKRARKSRANREIIRRLSKWDARMFQFMLAYKAAWFGLPVKFVKPAYSSRTRPVCSAPLKVYRSRLMRCKGCGLIIDRDEAVALNLRMQGARGSPREADLWK